MSQIESQSGPVGAIRRNRLPDTQLPGVTERLATPGLDIPPPVSPGAQVADQLLTAFSSLNGASAAIIRQRAYEASVQEERDRVAKANAREVEIADRGLANQHAGQDLPELVSKIDRGEVVPEEGESVRDFVSRIAREGTEGQSQAYIDQRVSRIGDNLATALQQRRDKIKNQAEADNAALAIHSIDGASDPAAFAEAVSAVRKFRPEISQTVAEDEVGKRWLDNAVALARTNPEEATKILAAARGTLGNRLQTEQLIAQDRYDAAVAQDRIEKFQALKDDVGQMLDHNAPYSSVLAYISEQGKKLGIDVHDIKRQVDTEHNVLHNRRETDAAQAARAKDQAQRDAEEARANLVSDKLIAGEYAGAEAVARASPPEVSRRFVLGLIDQVQSHAARATREAAEQVKAQEKFAFTNSAFSSASAMVESGLGNLIQDATGVASDGTEFKITANELREQAMTARFAQIAEKFKGDPARTDAGMIDEAARNAYFPSGWKALINGAASKLTTAAIATSKDGTIPADVTRGYDWFKKLSSRAPGLLDSMSLDSRTKELFATAMELEKIPNVGADPVSALTSAANIVDGPDTVAPSTYAEIGKQLDLASKSDIDIARDAAPLARIFVRSGQSPEAAVSRAIETVNKHRIEINGWSSRIGNVPPQMRYQFADVAENKLAEYAKSLEGGIDKHDLAFRYDSNNGLWQIVQRDTGLSVPTDDPSKTFFTTPQLIAEATRITEAEAIKRFKERKGAGVIVQPGFMHGGSGF